MLPIIVKIIIGLSLAISSFYIIKNLIKSDVKLFEIHNFSLLFLLLLPTVCFLDIKYNMLVSLLTYILSVIVLNLILLFQKGFLYKNEYSISKLIRI